MAESAYVAIAIQLRVRSIHSRTSISYHIVETVALVAHAILKSLDRSGRIISGRNSVARLTSVLIEGVRERREVVSRLLSVERTSNIGRWMI